jgi:hypothetical protein
MPSMCSGAAHREGSESDQVEGNVKCVVIVVVLGLCLALIAGCGPLSEPAPTETALVVAATPTSSAQPVSTASPTATQGEGSTRHYEPEGGFSYLPPVGWQVVESSSLAYKAAVGPVENEFAPNLTVIDEAFSGSFEDYVELSLDNMSEFFQEFELLSREEFAPEKGPTGVKAVTQTVQGGRTLRQTFYMFDTGGQVLVVTCTRIADAAEELDAT